MPDLAGTKRAYFGFTGGIDSPGATRIAAAMNSAVNGSYDEVHLNFSSLGGYVADGIYLYNHIRALPLKVIAYNSGSVSSIAVTVFLAAEERYCSAHSMFLIHPTAIPASETMGAERLRSFLDSALADDARTENILRERASIPDELLAARYFRDVHINPKDATTYGIVSGVRDFTLPRGQQIIQI
jgi:ATP-dependent Clp protease protease subunit